MVHRHGKKTQRGLNFYTAIPAFPRVNCLRLSLYSSLLKTLRFIFPSSVFTFLSHFSDFLEEIKSMARFVILFALCVLPALVAATRPVRTPFVVRGKVYCDTCLAGFETSATTYIPGIFLFSMLCCCCWSLKYHRSFPEFALISLFLCEMRSGWWMWMYFVIVCFVFLLDLCCSERYCWLVACLLVLWSMRLICCGFGVSILTTVWCHVE